MQTRPLAHTGKTLSVLGFGGIVVTDRPQPDADTEVARAVERGVTYFDVAPGYGDAQQKLGPALEPYRDRVTLACKTGKRDAEGAADELADSLAKLRTDRFDIYQLHGMTTSEDFDRVMADGGALDVFREAKDRGQADLIGFSAHDEDVALRLIDTGHFDTMLVPLNYVAYTCANFGPRMLRAANDAGMGVLALKSMARGRVEEGGEKSYKKCCYHPEDRPEIAELLLRFTLGLPGVSAALPPGDPGLFNLAMQLTETRPITEALSDTELATLDEATRTDLAPIFAA